MNSPGRFRKIVGWLFVLLGLLCNEFVLGALFSRDGEIGEPILRVAIAAFELACIGLGLILARARFRSSRQFVIVLVFYVLAFAVSLEVSFRVFYAARDAFSPLSRELDDDLGWRTRADQNQSYDLPGYGKVRYSTHEHGFRVWGDVSSKKKKVFVLGDSFTQAWHVSDGETYYDALRGPDSPFEVFAYGCGAYGTLQEYMILDRHVDEIRPDIVLWQFCTNDLITNDPELEELSVENNNYMVRPYLVDGEVIRRYPGPCWVPWSYVVRKLHVAADSYRLRNGSIEQTLTPEHPLYVRSRDTMAEIMRMVRERAAPARVVAFSVNAKPWAGSVFEDVCQSAGIDFIPGIPEAILAGRRAGRLLGGSDGNAHWNAEGHALAGTRIRDALLALPADAATGE